MRRWISRGLVPLATAGLLILWTQCGTTPGVPKEQACRRVERLPRIHPDYTGIVIPPNIAPLNFCIDETGTEYCVRVSSRVGKPVVVYTNTPAIQFPLLAWRALLDANRGHSAQIAIYARREDGSWSQFEVITNQIAPENIDSYLAYRLMEPWYMKYRSMGIFQRNLTNFEESPIIDTKHMGRGCVNCHSFVQNRPETMTIQVRFPFAMLVCGESGVTAFDTRTEFNKGPFAYTSWHPNGRLGAFSVNKILQVYHTAGEETRDIVDFASDLVVYDLGTNLVNTSPAISRRDRLETFPAWSPDGRFLYFCSGPPMPTENYNRHEEIRYDLMRISYDPDTGAWGEHETLLRAGKTGLSASMPRVSPDGCFVVVCMSRYNTFPIFQGDTDLYMYDVEKGTCTPLACNSDRTESWHGWASNGRWIVFSSKRRDGLFARPYFSYVDTEGKAAKAFVLPQEDPTLYDSWAKTYSVPELITGPVRTRMRHIIGAIRAEDERHNVRLDPAVQLPTSASPESPTDTEPEEGAWPTVKTQGI